jgi:hypothetical protein
LTLENCIEFGKYHIFQFTAIGDTEEEEEERRILEPGSVI